MKNINIQQQQYQSQNVPQPRGQLILSDNDKHQQIQMMQQSQKQQQIMNNQTSYQNNNSNNLNQQSMANNSHIGNYATQGQNSIKPPVSVPPLAFNGFNLNEAPLMRLPDQQQQQQQDLTGLQMNSQDGRDQGPGQYFDSQQLLTTQMDAQKRPPVTIKQTDVVFLPDMGCRDAVLTFDLSQQQHQHHLQQFDDEQLPLPNLAEPDQQLNSSSDAGSVGIAGELQQQMQMPPILDPYFDEICNQLMYLSNQEASHMLRSEIKENDKARTPLGDQAFQQEFKRGVRAIGVSPDGQCVAILTQELAVMIHDKITGKTSKVQEIDSEFFKSPDTKTLEKVINNYQSRRGNLPLDCYNIYISNNATKIFVVSLSEHFIALWIQNFCQNIPDESRKISKKTKVEDDMSIYNKSKKVEMNSNKFLGLQNEMKTAKDVAADPKSSQKQEKPVVNTENVDDHKTELLSGRWTNITIHSSNKIEISFKPLVSTSSIQFNSTINQQSPYLNGLPIRFGQSRSNKTLSEFQEEGSLISVKMFDWATYQNLFDSKLYSDLTCENSPRTFKKHKSTLNSGMRNLEELDTDTRKVLVFTQQTVEQDKIFKGNTWYQQRNYLVEKFTFATEIEYMGLLPEQVVGNQQQQQRTLVSKCDNQGNLLAVAVNSIHKIYCQVMFVSLKNQFVSLMKLFEFVSADDNPPFDNRGKTNLQIDDLAWTRNDAFLILMFNTGAIAVLPRLGSQLLKIYNPTIINVNLDGFEHYKVPRGFNELFPQNDILNKVKQMPSIDGQSQVLSTGYRIQMHPTEEAFIIYNGAIAYLMELELEPELEEMFDHENKSYYFMRFCFSMKSLSKDQETLQKIPQLLTSKLPICEFDKNQDKLDNEQPDENIGKRIQTASQINPWQMEDKRMDTIQSFDADFNEECEIVLLNFKQLLFSYRWNAATTINYLEWLVTVTNDIFYYFLKHSEPMYAYHTLKISEYYMTQVFQKSQNIDQFKPMESHKSTTLRKIAKSVYQFDSISRPDQIKKDSFGRTSKMFTGLYQRMLDPVIEIYTDGLASKTLQGKISEIENTTPTQIKEDLQYVLKEEMTLSDKIKSKCEFMNKLPMLVNKGDGNTGFQFQKNYILLAYYCLIQFRNYQASNFNILFLILSSYIVRAHVNAAFIDALQHFTSVIIENHCMLDKTDELDLFFGRCGRNVIKEAPAPMQFAQKWTEMVTPHQSSFSFKVINQKSLNAIQSQNYSRVIDPYRKKVPVEITQDIVLTPGKVNQKRQPIKPDILPLVEFFNALDSTNYSKVISLMQSIADSFHYNKEKANMITPVQAMGISVTLFANSMYHMLQGGQRSMKSVSALSALDCIARQGIKMDKKSPINTISEHTKLYDHAFAYMKSPGQILEARKDLFKLLEIDNCAQMKKLTAMMLAYSGDFCRAAKILKPSQTNVGDLDLLMFNLNLQSQSFKNHSSRFLLLRDLLQDYSMKNVKDFKSLHQTTERLNAMHCVKFNLAEINCTMNRIMTIAAESSQYKDYLWACFNLVPSSVQIILKEQVSRDSLDNIKAIFALQTKNEKDQAQDYDQIQSVLKEFPLAKSFFMITLDINCEHLEHILPLHPIIRRQFFRQIELLLICFYDQQKNQVIFDTAQEIAAKQQKRVQAEKTKNCTFGLQELATERVQNLLIKNFRKFVKLFTFLKIRTDIRSMECKVLQCRKSNNKIKAIESQIMICCKSLQHLVHFPKLTNVQIHVRRALLLLTQHLFHIGDIISLDLRNKILLPVINMISYNKLGRQNKQIVAGILEKCKQKQDMQKNGDDFGPIIRQLESIIFDRSMINPLADVSPNLSKDTRRGSRSKPSVDLQPETQDVIEFRKMIEEVMNWLRFSVLPNLKLKEHNEVGRDISIKAKREMIENAWIMNVKLNLPMLHCSLFYRGINFEVKHVNVFGLEGIEITRYKQLKGFQQKDVEVQRILTPKEQYETLISGATENTDKKTESDHLSSNLSASDHFLFQLLELDMKRGELVTPHLDLDLLILGQNQLFDQKDLAKNVDLSDNLTISGSGFLHKEIQLMQVSSLKKAKEMEEQMKTHLEELRNSETNKNSDGAIPEEDKQSKNAHERKKSTTPIAFSNEFSIGITDLSSQQQQTTKDSLASLSTTLATVEENQKTDKGPQQLQQIYTGGDQQVDYSIKNNDLSYRKNIKKRPADGQKKKIKTCRKASLKRQFANVPTMVKVETPEMKKQRELKNAMHASQFMSKHAKAEFAKKLMDSNEDKDPILLELIEAAKFYETKKEDNKRQASSQVLKPFSLVYLTKKTMKSTKKDGKQQQPPPQYKVEMPFKMIAESFANKKLKMTPPTQQPNKQQQNAAPDDQQLITLSQIQEIQEADENENESLNYDQLSEAAKQADAQNIKPFHLHLVKMPKNRGKRGAAKQKKQSDKPNSTSKGRIKIIENMQETCMDIKEYGKEKFMTHLINKLEEIQDKTETLKKKLFDDSSATQPPASQDQESKKDELSTTMP